ncbi:MAG: cyclopropane-fatty-acyl-phospholipid synthase family protein [Thermoguttaceae bacterium]|jgi:cyclopropane-fatty-acyl-phospholipid synthase
MSLSVSHRNVGDTQTGGNGREVSAATGEFSSSVGLEGQARLSSRKESAFCQPSSSAFERWLCRGLLKTLGDPPVSLVLWDGKEIKTSDQRPVARVIIGDRPTLRRLILDPEFQFSEAYSQGRLEVDGDLRVFLELIYRTRLQSPAARHPLKKIWSRLLHARRPNSVAASRENIYRHYDVGNDFYQLWLDPRMIYSCAYFAREDMTLAEAQLAKMDYVCRKLWLRPGETVVDVGGGWGGLALHMARHYGVAVKAFNISRQQNELARRRARAEGLDGRVEFIEDDYRNITGHFDALVSLGMLEHVGKRHYRDFGRMADRCLVPHGRGLIQTIAQSQPGETNPWIQRRIFPGGHAPTLREMTGIVEPFGFSVLDLENLRPHYARTLGHWLEQFEASADKVEKMFDAKFVRMWRLYLSGSWAAFTSGTLELFQFLFARPALNEVPKTRTHLYRI